MKTYIDRSASPDFKLGIALSASDFLKGEMVRTMAISNFDEMTAGNAMKYASCVNDKGDMDFGTVENLFLQLKQLESPFMDIHWLGMRSKIISILIR